MTPERWADLIGQTKDKIPDCKSGREPYPDGPGEIEYLEFTSPAGEFRLEYITRPLVTGKKTSGGRRVGVATAVQYEYSDTEQTHSFRAHRRNGAVWQEIDASSFAA